MYIKSLTVPESALKINVTLRCTFMSVATSKEKPLSEK